jgi:hypothetical protein
MAVLAGSGCGGNKHHSSAATTTTVTPSTTTTTRGTTTSSTTPSTTDTTSGGGCTSGARPADAQSPTEASADFDGDGRPDTLVVYSLGRGGGTVWHVRIERAAGEAVEAVIDGSTPDARASALGGAEISASAGLPPDGSGVEAFVEVGAGAADALVGIYQLRGCTLTRLAGPDGGPSTFAVGGSVTQLDGLRCDGVSGGQRLAVLTATSDDGTTYHTSDRLLRADGSRLQYAGEPVAGSLAATDPSLSAYSTVSCPGVASP